MHKVVADSLKIDNNRPPVACRDGLFEIFVSFILIVAEQPLRFWCAALTPMDTCAYRSNPLQHKGNIQDYI